MGRHIGKKRVLEWWIPHVAKNVMVRRHMELMEGLRIAYHFVVQVQFLLISRYRSPQMYFMLQL